MKAFEDQTYLKKLSRYFVLLSCWETLPTNQTSYIAISGFMLSVEDHWFFITAGHVFEEIRYAEKAGAQFHSWSLDDTFALPEKRPIYVDGPDVIETLPIQFDWENVLYSSEAGRDYGMLYLRDFYVRSLKANGVLAFDEQDCDLNGIEKPANRVELIGVPSDQVEETGKPGFVKKRLLNIPLHKMPISEIPDPEINGPHMLPAYMPNISAFGISNFESLKGMSGGPVIGFWKEEDGREIMKVLGIQNTWYEHQSAIIAFPISYVVEVIKSILDYVRNQNETLEYK